MGLRGRLTQGKTTPSIAIQPSGRLVNLTGDEQSVKVLSDERLSGYDIEVRGRYETPGQLFRVDPIHTKSIFAWVGDHRYFVTYYCDVCSIRTYAPGKCACCQADTRLDLVEAIGK